MWLSEIRESGVGYEQSFQKTGGQMSIPWHSIVMSMKMSLKVVIEKQAQKLVQVDALDLSLYYSVILCNTL